MLRFNPVGPKRDRKQKSVWTRLIYVLRTVDSTSSAVKVVTCLFDKWCIYKEYISNGRLEIEWICRNLTSQEITHYILSDAKLNIEKKQENVMVMNLVSRPTRQFLKKTKFAKKFLYFLHCSSLKADSKVWDNFW